MEYRLLGRSGLKVSVLSLGTMTFGGQGNLPKPGKLTLRPHNARQDYVLMPGLICSIPPMSILAVNRK